MVKEFFKELIPHGYRCFLVDRKDFETLCEIEQSCKSYALSLGATLYKSSSEWYNKYWNKDSLIEIT